MERFLHLEHICAQIRQHDGRVRTLLVACEVEDANAMERAWHRIAPLAASNAEARDVRRSCRRRCAPYRTQHASARAREPERGSPLVDHSRCSATLRTAAQCRRRQHLSSKYSCGVAARPARMLTAATMTESCCQRPARCGPRRGAPLFTGCRPRAALAHAANADTMAAGQGHQGKHDSRQPQALANVLLLQRRMQPLCAVPRPFACQAAGWR